MSSSFVRCSTRVAGGVVVNPRTGVEGSSERSSNGVDESAGISCSGVGGFAGCWREDWSTTGEGGSGEICGDLSGVAASCLTCVSPTSKLNGSRMVASEDASCTYWGTWALGPPPSLSREGRVPSQDTFSMNYSTVRMDPGGATTCKLCSNKICPWWRL